MKKVPLILTIALIGVIGGVFLVKDYLFKSTSVNAWSILPEQTVLVYEVGDCIECYAQLDATSFAQLLSNIFFSVKQDSVIAQLKEVAFNSGNLISIQSTAKNDFDAIFFLNLNSSKKLREALLKSGKTSSRLLNDVTIYEYSIGKEIITWVELDGLWVGSFTPFLIEDVVRIYSTGATSEFTKRVADIYSLPRVKNDPGNLYINLKGFISLLSTLQSYNTTLGSIGNSSLLDIKLSDGIIELNGFTSSGDSTLLSHFEGQSPVQFDLKRFVSSRSISVTDYGLSNPLVFLKGLDISKSKDIKDSLSKISGSSVEQLYSFLGNELAVCNLENKSGYSKILMFKVTETKKWLDFFNRVSSVSETGDTLFYERFSDYEIREIELIGLPEKLFSPLVKGFSKSYYTSIGDVILISERLDELKYFLEDIDNEDVWGKLIAYNRFLESTLLESNVSLYVNTPLVLNGLISSLDPKWKEFLTQPHNQTLIKSFGFGAIQFSTLNKGFYTNIVWRHSPTVVKKEKETVFKGLVASLPSSLKSGPFVVRSHVSKSDEVLVQDSLDVLYHLSGDGKIIWSVKLDGPIISDVRQVDYFKNGKLQFFFTTAHKLYLIDRLGNFVSPFPSQNLTQPISFAEVADYDNSKNYRFLVTDKMGKVWMMDKTINALDGWRPKNLGGSLLVSARHHRVLGKDYIAAFRSDGTVYLMNRRGENVKGFPLELNARLDGDYFIEVNDNITDSYFVCVSKDGFRIKFDFSGKVLSRETLLKTSVTTDFSLVPEESRRSYVMKRQDDRALTILNEDAKEIISNSYVGKAPVVIKYYDFGGGKKYIVITDLAQELSYVYKYTGELLTTTPVESSSLELKAGNGDFPRIFSVHKNTLTIQ